MILGRLIDNPSVHHLSLDPWKPGVSFPWLLLSVFVKCTVYPISPTFRHPRSPSSTGLKWSSPSNIFAKKTSRSSLLKPRWHILKKWLKNFHVYQSIYVYVIYLYLNICVLSWLLSSHSSVRVRFTSSQRLQGIYRLKPLRASAQHGTLGAVPFELKIKVSKWRAPKMCTEYWKIHLYIYIVICMSISVCTTRQNISDMYIYIYIFKTNTYVCMHV